MTTQTQTTTPTPTSQTDRHTEILAVVDKVIREHDTWADDRDSSDIPPNSMDEAVLRAGEVCSRGSIPGELGRLVMHVVTLADVYNRFMNNEFGFVIPGRGEPTSKIWNEFREIFHLRKQVSAPKTVNRETVSRQLEQGVSPELIAKSFGTRSEDGVWTGPFHREGKPSRELVLQQAKFERGESDGKQILDESAFVVTLEEDTSYDKDELENKITSLKAKSAPAPEPPKDKGSPEELAMGGAFPYQVRKAFPHLTEAEIEAAYNRVGLGIDMEHLASDRPSEEQPIGHVQSESTEDNETTEDPQPQPEPTPRPVSSAADLFPEPISQDALAKRVLMLHRQDESLSPADIGRRLSEELGEVIDGRSVASIIARHRRQQAE